MGGGNLFQTSESSLHECKWDQTKSMSKQFTPPGSDGIKYTMLLITDGPIHLKV